MNNQAVFSKAGRVGLVSCAVLVGTLTGCVRRVEDRPRPGHVYIAPPPLERVVVVEDDYVYYPGYEVYYNNRRHQYIYLEGRSWVTRPTPPRVSVDVLFASPSVIPNFHDSPAHHHSAMVQRYPRNWAPPGANHGPGGNWKNDQRGERHEK